MNNRASAVVTSLQRLGKEFRDSDEDTAQRFIIALFDAGFVLEPRTSGMRR